MKAKCRLVEREVCLEQLNEYRFPNNALIFMVNLRATPSNYANSVVRLGRKDMGLVFLDI
ncbi:hypothetical protein [Vibrio sp. dhg]|uniref:hypothetical protein n=1 Tax=Vibrio sp. dhg TaxID=2163016 RepID=UPI0013C37076|nr:hypothetical protein [Vibrio sp. dhg]